MDAIFKGIFDNELTQLISVQDFLLCLGVSLVLGLIMALAYMFKNEHTKSFLVTLALLPAVVCVVIMMVNGNIGAGVAVALVFGHIRQRLRGVRTGFDRGFLLTLFLWLPGGGGWLLAGGIGLFPRWCAYNSDGPGFASSLLPLHFFLGRQQQNEQPQRHVQQHGEHYAE